VAKRLGKVLGVDPWLINPMFDKCSEVDVSSAPDMERLSNQVDALLTKIRRRYKEYGIKEKPFVVVKTDSNADHLGILTVRDAKDLSGLSQVWHEQGAGSGSPHELLLQEGVLTRERMNDAVAEPVVYMMDRYVVGGFYRIHAGRGSDEILNAPGSAYVSLAFEQSSHLPQPGVKPGASAPNRFYMYGVVARLAMLAASYELELTDPEAEVYA
jgi:glutamate--cysteine ligase